ncbi:hypothetical protein BOX15_Mlig011958g2, partial [Macrostomum lignano]
IMPIRANPATAALLAGGVSISAIILLIYLKLRGNNTQNNKKSCLPKPDDCDTETTKLTENSISTFQTLLSDCVAKEAVVVEKTSESNRLDSEPEAAEESLSECEHHLEEEEEEGNNSDAVEEIVEEIIEPKEILKPLEAEIIMTTSTEALADCATKSSSSNNNNNEEVAANAAAISEMESKTESLTVNTGSAKNDPETVEQSDIVEQQQPGQDRVSNWLSKNQRYCRQQPHHHNNHCQSSIAHHRLEDASDDSGRPSSVDTAADAASPRSSATGTRHSSSTAVAVAMSLSPRQLQQQQESEQQALLSTVDNNAGIVEQFPDRSKVIRGVSPIPGDDNDIIHQFLIPNKLGGSMVGTRGRNINYIRAKSGASVWISRNFFDKKTQVVNVRGPAECVKAALQVIKKRFPELDVKPINTAVPIQRNPALQPTMCQLSLPVGALVDVNVCAMCRGTTVFMQQPTHPSFHHLEKMDYTIMKHYADQSSVPALPRPVNPGAVCVAPFGNAWHRAIIADVFPEEDLVLMKYLDWGGYERMPVGCLKQIRTEMMHLPFQAVEGHLAYVSPILTDDEDPDSQLEQLSRILHERYLTGKRIKAQVVYFNDVSQPCVYLYTKDVQSDSWHFLQEDLVRDGLAQWFQMPHPQPQMPQ